MKNKKKDNDEYINKEFSFSILKLVASLMLLSNAIHMFNSRIATVIGSFITVNTVIGIYTYILNYKKIEEKESIDKEYNILD